MTFFAPASWAVLVLVRCPACGELQARAAVVEGDGYDCRKCGSHFSKAEGRAAAEELVRARSSKR